VSLAERLDADLKEALKSGDKIRVDTIRMLKSELRNREIEKRGALDPDEEIRLLNSAVKKHKEAMELYEKGGRLDLYEKEKKELEIISQYLPEPLTREEVEKRIDEIIARTGAKSLKEIGVVMKEAMAEMKGRVDGRMVQEIVRSKLG